MNRRGRHLMLAAMLGLTLSFLGSCGDRETQEEGALELYVISPHGADIRREFQQAFSAWHKAHFGRAVRIQWPDIGSGGTGNISSYLAKLYEKQSTSGLDVMFGGGSAIFDQFAGQGFLEAPKEVGDDAQAFGGKDPLASVPADIFGTPLHGRNGAWVAAAMSSFGMEVNKDRIAELGLKTPAAWADLAGPEWVGRLSLSDPSKSGSVRSSYEQIFQQYGWEKGWALMTLMFANTEAVRDNGSAPAEDVGSAEAVAGIVIDFYGRLHVLRAGSAIAAFLVPEGGSTIDPDPIALLKGAPNAALAARFVRFVVSPEGQRLWTFKPGTPGGPRKATLGRLSVLPTLYEGESSHMLDPRSPFKMEHPLKIDAKIQATRGRFLGELLKSALVDNHRSLVEARRAIKAAGDPPELLARLTSVPSFVTSSVGEGRELTFAAPSPLTGPDQDALAEEFAPSPNSPKGVYRDRLQTKLKDLWRRELESRFADLTREAQSRSPKPH